tara:strand:+ start:54 stop:782 length:729 start_codon:yes stop_codon:yes gene_type:complete
MAVSIDTVYQRVLTLANKEQRGYITPQEFNLMANQAQMELFEQYFFDVRQFNRVPGNSQEYSDPLNVLYERIGIFEVEQGNTWMLANMPVVNDYLQIPEEIYKIGTVRVTNRQVELLNSKDYDAARISPLTSPTLERPIGYISNRGLKISIGDNLPNPVPGGANNLNISYIKKPSKVQWAYVVVNDKALYNDNVSVDFELHQSEETELVYKILKLAGINLKAQDVTEAGAGLEMAQVQQEKA